MQKQTWINVYLATDIGLILVILVVLPLHQTGAKLFSVVFFSFIHQSAVLYPSIPLSIHYDHLVAAWRSNGPAWLLVMYSLYSQHPHLCRCGGWVLEGWHIDAAIFKISLLLHTNHVCSCLFYVETMRM